MGSRGLDPARHARAAHLFLAAVDLPPQEQAAFLSPECANDLELLEMVRQLLAEDRNGSILPEPKPAASPSQESLSGLTLSHYRVLERVGEGGMGTVYCAADTRLDRVVALKFEPPEILGVIASRDRFWREAKAIASIDHPNVCPVYGIEEDGGFLFIAMAYLDGIPLDRRLASSRVSMNEAVQIVMQAGRGLEAAHAKGIVHRDIKPANLMLTPTTRGEYLVRILDFGIAQSVRESPATSDQLTMGTVCYMAPEQIRPGRVDAQGDIWSLGIVFYEILTGRLPFDRGSVQETLEAIAGPAPADFSLLRPEVPSSIVAVLERMLAKDLAKRYRSVRDVVADLERADTAASAKPRPVSSQWSVSNGALVALVVFLIAAFVLAFWSRSAQHARGTLSLTPITFYPGYEQNPAISPDGSRIAYVGQGLHGTNPLELYVQAIGSTDPLRLTRNRPGVENRSPAWSPKGDKLAVLETIPGTRFARILLMPAQGGTGSDLAVDNVLATGRLAWSSSGKKLAFTRLNGADQGVIYELTIDSGALRQASFPAPGQSDCCAEFDPTDRRVAFKRNEVEIVVIDERTGAVRSLPARASWPGLTWSADGRSLLFSWFGRIGEVSLTGAARRQPAREFRYEIMDITVRGAQMACVRWEFEHSIWSLELRRSLDRTVASEDKQLIASSSWDNTPQFSPDGNSIAFSSGRSATPEIWVAGADGLNARRLTFFDGQFTGTPRWSPDGKRIVFDGRMPASKPSIYVVPASGGQPVRLTNAEGDVPSWSRDGRWIYYHSRPDDQIWKIPDGGGHASRVTRGGGFEAFESTDGRSLIYSKSDQGLGLWKLDLNTGQEQPIPELAEADDYRHWALAPRGIYFVPRRETESAQPGIYFFEFTTGRTTRVAQVQRLVDSGPGALAVSPDEARLLYVPAGRDNRDVMLVKNFR
jgi:serine/threonine protein kinase/dipeptidyl aminopeptidase/acylaminoacyl peptidase